MRWKSKVISENGRSFRIRRKFCLLPLTVNGEVIWLEWVIVKEEFRRGFIDSPEIPYLSWKVDEIIDGYEEQEGQRTRQSKV